MKNPRQHLSKKNGSEHGTNGSPVSTLSKPFQQNEFLMQQLKSSLNLQDLPESLSAFLDLVGKTYDQYEQEHDLLLRSIEQSYSEMIDLNEKLKRETIGLQKKSGELNRILQNINEVVFSLNAVTSEYIYISASCEKVYGYTADEFKANALLWKEVIYLEDTMSIDPHDERLYRGEQMHVQYRILHKNKSIRWIDARIIPTLNESGQLSFLDIIVNDITDTKEAQQKLEVANTELNKLFNNVSEVLYSVDMVSYRLIQMSPACERVYGYTPKEFLMNQNLWREVVYPEDQWIIDQHITDLDQGKQVINQYRIIHKDGSIRWISNKIFPTLNAEGKLIRLDGLTMDATEKIINEQKLRESEVRFRSLIENSEDMLSLLDASCKIVYESPAVLRTLNYGSNGNIGRSGFELLHPQDHAKAQAALEFILENEEVPVPLAPRIRTKDGIYIYTEGYVVNQLHVQGINAIVCNFRDITSRVEAELDLSESQKRYRLVYENPFLGISLGSIDGHIQNVNETFCNMVGFSQKEISGMHFSEFTPAEDCLLELPFIEKMRAGKLDNYQLEKRYLTKSGKMIWVELSVSCARDENGNIQFVVAVVQDITLRKSAEEKLQKSEANLKNILENTDTSFVLLDQDEQILSFNKAAKQLAKQETGENLTEGKNYVNLMLKAGRTEIKEILQRAQEKKKRVRYEIKYPNKDKWLSVSMFPIFDQHKNVLGMSVASNDITERKKTEQLIKESNERYELVTKATNDVIWDWDITKNKIFRSDNYKQIFGFIGSGDNIYSRSTYSHIHPDDRERIFKSIAETIQDSNSIFWEDEYRYYRSNGEMAYVQDRGYIIYDEDKKPVRMVGAMRDITSEKLFALERDKITSDLIRQNKDLEQFAYIVSHNLRAPLANIMGLSRIIQTEKPQSPIYKVGLEGLGSSVKKLDNVITDLGQILQVKREINEKKETVLFNSLVSDIKASIGSFKNSKDMVLLTDFSKANTFFTLKSYLHSIFYNLITNSIKYRKAGEQLFIEISSEETESELVLTFKDNGQGIDLVANGDKVFGLYKRFHSNVEGKGMGLFMVKTQVETLGGKITVDSEVNVGTEFKLHFEKQDKRMHSPAATKEHQEGNTSNGTNQN